jgi:serine/threonine protein kinase
MLTVDQVLQDRYQLKQKLGHNAGRQTWLAQDLETSESVVVKLLTFGGDVQWDDLKLFEREAQVLQQLDHPRIPKYRDYFSIDDKALWFGLVQEYIPGKSLRELLDSGKKFTDAQVLNIAIAILEILIYLHELSPSVLHRDIKPSNLIAGADEQIYLVDFGAVQDKASAEGKTFTVVGTYGYAPMEQFGGRAVPASDLYALGATLIHLLTGLSPADLPQADDASIQFSDRTGAAPRLVKWIEKLTAPAVKFRFSNARQALAAFESGAVLRPEPKPKSVSQTPIARIPANLFDTRITVTRSQSSLNINIPGRMVKSIVGKTSKAIGWEGLISSCLLVYILISLLSMGFLFPLVPILLIVGFVGFPLLFDYYGSTNVEFNQNFFEIKNEMFNRSLGQSKGLIADIQYVLAYARGTAKNGDPISMAIAIQTKSKRNMIGGLTAISSPIKPREAAWLVQEIQNWLAEINEQEKA